MERALYYYEYVSKPAGEIVAAITKPGSEIFSAATNSAVHQAEVFKERLHVDVAGLEIGRDVVVVIGSPEDKGYAVLIPIKWRAADESSLFPSMDAALEVSPLAIKPPWTQVGISGRYRPPMGVLGAVGNALIGHRIAEASVKQFITDLAARLNRI